MDSWLSSISLDGITALGVAGLSVIAIAITLRASTTSSSGIAGALLQAQIDSLKQIAGSMEEIRDSIRMLSSGFERTLDRLDRIERALDLDTDREG